MKALLMHRDRDFDMKQSLPWNERALTQDLELDTLLRAMADNDEFLFDVARKAIFSGFQNDVDTILYRQEIVQDCLKNPAVVRDLYVLIVEAIERARKQWWGLSNYPDSLLYSSIELIESSLGTLRKSSFLRSIGLAQLMMQCGMFIGAEAFTAELCPTLLTHYKREEDATMTSGKLDEELARMSEIVDHIEPNSMLLFNESFAATNEREGSEIARQIVCALLEKRIKIFYVTHLYEFAHDFFNRKREDAIFLRAERNADGTRTFRLLEAVQKLWRGTTDGICMRLRER